MFMSNSKKEIRSQKMLRYLFLGIMLARNLQAYSLIDEGKMMRVGQSTYGVLKPYMLYDVRIGSFSDVLLLFINWSKNGHFFVCSIDIYKFSPKKVASSLRNTDTIITRKQDEYKNNRSTI